MPDIESSSRYQKAVLWVYADHDRHGRVQVSAAVELTVRWETVTRTIMGDDGTPTNIDVVAIVDRAIASESIMWLGKLADVPSPTTNLMQVEVSEAIPDIKGRVTQYAVLLKRYGAGLPEIV